MSSRTKAHLALLTVAVIYSANYIIAKDLMPGYIQPRGFIFVRVIGAAALFFLLGAITGHSQKIAREDWLRVFACGFFGVAANQILFFEGLNLTTPINAAVIMTNNPVLVLVISAILLKERLKPIKIAGVLIGGTGAVLLIMGSSGGAEGLPDVSWGNLLIFLNATSFAVYLVIAKPLMQKYDALTVIKWVFLSGMVFVVPLGTGQFLEIDWNSWTSDIYLSALFVVVCTTFLAYLLNVFALKTLSSTTVSTYIYLQPVFTTAAALFLAKDKLTIDAALSAMLIFVGVYLVGRKPSSKKVQS